MTEKNLATLTALIERKIELASVLKQTAESAAPGERRIELVVLAKSACDTAERFMRRVGVREIKPLWQSHLAEIKRQIHDLHGASQSYHSVSKSQR